MKKIFKFYFAIFALFLSACSIHEQTKINTKNAKAYYGILPCASCPGIKTWIYIHEDGRFGKIEEYLEEKNAIFKEEGFVLNRKDFYTLKSKNLLQNIIFKDGGIYILDKNNKINKMYFLKIFDEKKN